MPELKAFGHSWWCRGGGAAVLVLLAVVGFFRHPRDTIFWIAIAFFVTHTALAVRRYLVERKARSTAVVLRHHQTQAPTVVFTPRPASGLLMPLKITTKDLAQQTKTTL